MRLCLLRQESAGADDAVGKLGQGRALNGQPVGQEGADQGLVPYRRGVSLREIAKGAFARFLPGSLVSLGGLALVFDLSMRGGALATVGVVLGFAGALTLGFGSALLVLRSWLYPDAQLGGQRSLLAGLFAPFVLFAATAAGVGLAQLPVLLFVIGVITALGMFFAWLSPTPEGLRGAEFEPEPSERRPKLGGGAP